MDGLQFVAKRKTGFGAFKTKQTRYQNTKEGNSFVRMPHYVLTAYDLNNSEKVTYAALRSHFNGNRKHEFYLQCFPKQCTIADEAKQSEKTVQRNIANLKKRGYIKVKRGKYGSNFYEFPDVDYDELRKVNASELRG